MAEAAGLALGVLGIVGLFTSCVENFEIVVRAKEFSKEFDLQCTLVGAHYPPSGARNSETHCRSCQCSAFAWVFGEKV